MLGVLASCSIQVAFSRFPPTEEHNLRVEVFLGNVATESRRTPHEEAVESILLQVDLEKVLIRAETVLSVALDEVEAMVVS